MIRGFASMMHEPAAAATNCTLLPMANFSVSVIIIDLRLCRINFATCWHGHDIKTTADTLLVGSTNRLGRAFPPKGPRPNALALCFATRFYRKLIGKLAQIMLIKKPANELREA